MVLSDHHFALFFTQFGIGDVCPNALTDIVITQINATHRIEKTTNFVGIFL